MGGMPAGDLGGGMPGMDGMGGDPLQGGSPGDVGAMPGTMGLGSMVPGSGFGGGGGGATASDGMNKITKKGKGKTMAERQKEMTQNRPMTENKRLTKLEAKVLNIIRDIDVPYQPFFQYQVKMGHESQPFVLDFAYPEIGIGIECDGTLWHEQPDLKERDMERDQKLASAGWRVLRFPEEAINDNLNAIKDIIYQNILEAHKEIKNKNGKKQNK